MRYKMLMEQVISDIEKGRRAKASRMPSLRKMAQLSGFSITTVQKAFYQLEELGWLVAKPQSGFFVSAPLTKTTQPLQPHFSSKPSDLASYNVKQGEFTASPRGALGIIQLSPKLVPYDAFKRSLKRTVQHLGDDIHFYPAPQGHAALRGAISEQFRRYDFVFNPQDLVISNGCIDAIKIALETVTQVGDTVAIASPCFNGLIDLLCCLGRKVLEIPCLPDGIDLDQFEAHLRAGNVQAGLFSTSHMNPQGISLSTAQKQRLASLANTFNVPIIEDDVYMELSHSKLTPLPAKHWDKQGNILWCGSVSKTLSASLRLGWCLPGRYAQGYINTLKVAQLGISAPIQLAVADFIDSGQYNKHLQILKTKLPQQVNDYKTYIADIFPQGTAISSPEGGMVLWLQFHGICSKSLIQHLKTADIDIRLGSMFSTLPLYQDCIRINCGWPLDQEIKETLKQLAEHVTQSLI